MKKYYVVQLYIVYEYIKKTAYNMSLGNIRFSAKMIHSHTFSVVS